MRRPIIPTLLTGVTGIVVGGRTTLPVDVHLHGWILNNSDGAAAHTLSFYTANPATNGNDQTDVPDAGDLHLFDISVPLSGNVPFWSEGGIHFKDGLFVVCDNAALTGIVLSS